MVTNHQIKQVLAKILPCRKKAVLLSSELAHNTPRYPITRIGCRNSSSSRREHSVGSRRD